MRKLILAIVLTVLFAHPVFADYMNSKGGSGGSSTNTNIFFGANQATLTGLSGCSDVVVSPDGLYTYNVGILASNSDVAVVKLKISDGSVVSTRDLLVAATGVETAEIDSTGANLYVWSGLNYWKLDASAMTITHTAAVTGGVADNYKGWDLSPNGTSLVYCNSNVDQTIHFINTTTYAVTNRTVGHSAGLANTYSVCFLDNTHVYVSYKTTSTIDDYTTAGAWVLAVDTTDAAGIKEMRAGVNGYLFLQGITQLETVDPAHNVTTYPNIPGPDSLAVDKGAGAVASGEDLTIVVRNAEDGAYILDGQYVGPSPVSFPAQAMWSSTGRVGITQDNSGRGFIGSESTPTPVLVSLSSDFQGFAGSGANTDILSLTGLTGQVTINMATDAVALKLTAANAAASNLTEWYRKDGFNWGSAGNNGLFQYYNIKSINNMTCWNQLQSFPQSDVLATWILMPAGATADPLNIDAFGSSGGGLLKLDINGHLTIKAGLELPPQTAPSNPASGWIIYTDTGDGNKLKAKASTGTVVLLGTP